MAQRVVQYQAAFQLSQSAPQLYDLAYLHRQMNETLGIKNIDKLIPSSEDATPRDPVSENMGALMGKPMKAFIYQDHEAHLATHQSFMQDPMIAQGIGQNPMAQQIMGSLQAHIAEHIGFLYRKQIEERLGAPLPGPDEKMPEEIELQLSRLIADAGKQLTQIHQQEAAKQQAQQQAQDPMFQLEQAKVQIAQQEAAAKMQKVQGDLAIRTQELQLKAQAEAAKTQANAGKTQAEMQANAVKTQADMERAQLKLQQDAQEFRQKIDQAAQMHVLNLQAQAERNRLQAQKARKPSKE
jgi:hypothetical protein